MKYFLQTFGCKSNQYESQAIREALAARGHSECDGAAEADTLVVNTCGVTGRAGASCRNAIRKALRANPALKVVITGCGVDLDEQWPDLPGFNPLLVPNAKKHALAAMMEQFFANASMAAPDDDRFALAITRFHGHTRAFLKVQDGCDNFCSYCAVPYARGKPESRPPAAVVEEARRLVDSGHSEIVLTGINIGAYHSGNMELAGLVRELAAVPGLARLRLGSVEPPQMTPALADAMADCPAVCPHVHLPLQSGDDGVLAKMARRYSAAEFLEKAAMLRERLVLPAITTDVIVGFPGEDENAARATEELCRKAGFSRLHVFLFSARPGTPAAAMRRTASDREIGERKDRLIALGDTLARDFAAACVDREEQVLIEKSGAGMSNRYIKTHIPGKRLPPGTLHRVVITGTRDAELEAELRDTSIVPGY